MADARFGLAACLGIFVLTANAATINRCVVGDKVIYSDQPCPSGATSSALSVHTGAARLRSGSSAERIESRSSCRWSDRASGRACMGRAAKQEHRYRYVGKTRTMGL